MHYVEGADVQALRSVYPDDASIVFSPTELERLKHAEELIAEPKSSGTDGLGCLSGCVNLPDIQLQGATVTVRFMLPAAYPDVPPSLQLIANAPRCDAQRLALLKP